MKAPRIWLFAVYDYYVPHALCVYNGTQCIGYFSSTTLHSLSYGFRLFVLLVRRTDDCSLLYSMMSVCFCSF